MGFKNFFGFGLVRLVLRRKVDFVILVGSRVFFGRGRLVLNIFICLLN